MISRLLERSGFRVRGNRADCVYCQGGSRGTVSFSTDVAYCHRCHWTANSRQLAKSLGDSVPPETSSQRQARTKIAAFESWLNSMHKEVAAEYRRLGRMAELAKQILSHFPNCEHAWEALARFYHAEAKLTAQLDVLSFEKVSDWLESPAEPFALFRKWEAANAPR